MEISIELAITAHREGRLDEAERLYLDILKIEPRHADANHNLGILKLSLNKSAEALPLLKTATQINPNMKHFWFNYANAQANEKLYKESEESFIKALNLDKNLVGAQCNLGVVQVNLNKLSEAELSFKKAIELNSSYLDAHYNLGTLLKDKGRLDEAEACYKKSIQLNPAYSDAYNRLGNILFHLGKINEAVKVLEKAIELKPNYPEAYHNLGHVLSNLGKLVEAEKCYKKAIELKPNYPEAFLNLGHAQLAQNKLEEAKKNFKKAIEIKPNLPEANHFLSAITGQTTKTAPRGYVENLFDNYAQNFENSLINKFEYNIPKEIKEIILRNDPEQRLGSVLDLGCGTGLIGDEINKYCSNLEGIDVSKDMLKQAEKKKIYNKLKQIDIIEYLSNEDLNFDYFISADVFIYVGELTEIFKLIKSRNKSNGKFVFSTEHNEKEGFTLEKSGRYSHSKKYIEKLCKKFDYKLSYFNKTNLRKSQNKFIIGGIYILNF